MRIDFQALNACVNAWATEVFAVSSSEQVAMDGKSIKASVKDYDNAYQDFISVVSAFSVQQGVVVGLQAMNNRGGSEIVTVQSLMDVLQLKAVCFSMDALHTQKKPYSKSLIVAMTT